MSDAVISAVVTGLVGFLTPLIIQWWSRAAPPADTSEFDAMGMDQLRARNNRIDVIGSVLSFCGLLSPLALYFGENPSKSGWPVGLMFGLMVLFPVTYFWLATRAGGIRRWHEFWRFYELKWGVGVRGLRWLYVPMGLLGIASMVMILLGF